MKNLHGVWRFLVLLLLVPVAPLPAAQPAKPAQASVEQRLQRLERILRNQSLADIILQLQQLQQEVQQLRGEVELQKHTMDAMNKRQRDLYLDIDQRLSRLSSAGGAGAGTAATPPTGAPGGATPQPKSPPSATASAAMSRATPATPPVPPKSHPPIDPKQEATAYQKAFNLLKQGRYQESIKAFRRFLKRFPGGNYEDNAQYWLGEASYVNRDFDTALVEFTKVVEQYPQSAKVPGALLKSGYIQYEKKHWAKARELFKQVSERYAGSTEARLAAKRLQRMHKEGH